MSAELDRIKTKFEENKKEAQIRTDKAFENSGEVITGIQRDQINALIVDGARISSSTIFLIMPNGEMVAVTNKGVVLR